MFSLIMATRNRSRDVIFFLKTLDKSTEKNFELIIVDQSTDENFKVLADYLKKVAFSFKHVRDFGVGLSRARNIGLQYIAGDYVLFPDDDCTYPDDFLSTVASNIETLGSNSKLVLNGRYCDPETNEFSSDLGKFYGDFVTVKKIESVCSVGLVIPSKAFTDDRLHFDERIGAGADIPGSEELDLMFSLVARGYSLRCSNDLFVMHKVSRVNVKGKALYLRHMARSYVHYKHRHIRGVLKKLIFGIFLDIVRLIFLKPLLWYRLRGIFLAIGRK